MDDFRAASRPLASVAGVLWVTGHSSAGKTTVARKVAQNLRRRGLATVHLDGDDLRAMFGYRWKYERVDREELARTYLRLCSYVAAQGITVVLSAVAMYEGVRAWAKENIPNAFQILLDVPLQERIRRDQQTKNVRKTIGETSQLYDEPAWPDLRVANHGDVTPQLAADRIVEYYLGRLSARELDHGKAEHWECYYQERTGVLEPSSFARLVTAEILQTRCRLLEIGCGNGRDAAFLAAEGHEVVAIDASAAAIARAQAVHKALPITFLAGTLGNAVRMRLPPFDAVYCRFVLHAMTEAEERDSVGHAYALLRDGGQFLIECRSINDPLARKGEVLSATERIFGHYRRFLVLDELAARLTACGFGIEAAAESKGVAACEDDDPVVIRIVARKAPPGQAGVGRP